MVAGHPQRAMMLAYNLFEQTEPRTAASSNTWARTLRAVRDELRDEFESTWSRMSDREQRMPRPSDNRAPLYSICQPGAARHQEERRLPRCRCVPRGWRRPGQRRDVRSLGLALRAEQRGRDNADPVSAPVCLPAGGDDDRVKEILADSVP